MNKRQIRYKKKQKYYKDLNTFLSTIKMMGAKRLTWTTGEFDLNNIAISMQGKIIYLSMNGLSPKKQTGRPLKALKFIMENLDND